MSKWMSSMPGGLMIDAEQVAAVEFGKYGTGSRLVLHSGRTIELPYAPQNLSELVYATLYPEDVRSQQMERRIDQLTADSEELMRIAVQLREGDGAAAADEEGGDDD